MDRQIGRHTYTYLIYLGNSYVQSGYIYLLKLMANSSQLFQSSNGLFTKSKTTSARFAFHCLSGLVDCCPCQHHLVLIFHAVMECLSILTVISQYNFMPWKLRVCCLLSVFHPKSIEVSEQKIHWVSCSVDLVPQPTRFIFQQCLTALHSLRQKVYIPFPFTCYNFFPRL